MIKSGGEWISSLGLEDAAFSHPDVAEAGVIAIADPKWQERPLMIVARHPNSHLQRDKLMAHLADRVAKWWLPDDIVFVEELPHTATGKLLKTRLRQEYSDHQPGHSSQ